VWRIVSPIHQKINNTGQPTCYLTNPIMAALRNAVAAAVFLSLLSALVAASPLQARQVGSPLQARQVGSSVQARQVGSSVQGPPVCAAYGEFLKGGQPDDFSKCSELGKFLMRNADLDPLRFLQDYQDLWQRGSPTEVLSRGLIFTLKSKHAKAFATLDIANTIVYAGYNKIEDSDRAFVYAVLIQRVKLHALRVGLGGNKSFLDDYPPAFFSFDLGPKFAILDRHLDHPEYSLICLMRNDNLQVPVEKVISSKRFHSCLAGAGKAK